MNIRTANESDLLEVCSWCSTEIEAKNWAGPRISYPFNLQQLKIDIEWHEAQSYALVGIGGELIGFAQLFNKVGFKHLGRIIICPSMRGQKFGGKLLKELFALERTEVTRFSLYVYKHNVAAINLYQSLGFKARLSPTGRSVTEDCTFMVKEA